MTCLGQPMLLCFLECGIRQVPRSFGVGAVALVKLVDGLGTVWRFSIIALPSHFSRLEGELR